MKRERSAGAVIFRRNGKVKYLLLKYGAGHWDFVKGHIEPGESEVETLLREAEEETGIGELEIVPGFRERIEYFYRLGKELVHKEVVFYLAEAKSSEVRLSYEHVDYAWLPFEEAHARVTYANAKRVLRAARDFLAERGIEVGTHQG
ncbi:bis(5'-nucleosyl)-tetraphosphatase [Candidatus Pyrohabitans sp.]